MIFYYCSRNHWSYPNGWKCHKSWEAWKGVCACFSRVPAIVVKCKLDTFRYFFTSVCRRLIGSYFWQTEQLLMLSSFFPQGHSIYIISIFLLHVYHLICCKSLDICVIFGCWNSCTKYLLLLNAFDDITLISGCDALPSDLVDLLVQTNLYDMAFTVVLKFWKDISLKRLDRLILYFFVMTSSSLLVTFICYLY